MSASPLSGPTRTVASLCAALALVSGPAVAQVSAEQPWQRIESVDASAPTPRHEAGAVAVDGRIYLFGGRGERPVEMYDPATERWSSLGAAPLPFHHVQPAAIGTRVYIVGALTGNYPEEPSVPDVHVFDTGDDSWSVAGSVPTGRLRGSAGVVARAGKLYVVGGNTKGHNGGAVPWFDEYDPATGEWTVLPDAPSARDHFQLALVGDKLIAAGGRRSTQPNPFTNAVAATDVYDFATGEWTTAAALPTLRAGTLSLVVDGEVLVIGGEIDTTAEAYDRVEAFDVAAGSWRTLAPLVDGRHGGGGARVGDALHVMVGSLARGGGPETATHERLALAGAPPDGDEDGLSDADETGVHGTDPTRADTDDDGLSDGDEVLVHGSDPRRVDSDGDGLGDGDEVMRGSDPTLEDSDGDGLVDGDEVALHGSDPTRADSDGDTLPDGDEVMLHGSDPMLGDSDEDGLGDAAEVEAGTDPRDADSDDDGVADGAEVAAGTDPLLAETGGGGSGGGSGDGGGTDGGSSAPRRSGGGGGIGAATWLLLPLLAASRRRRRAAHPAELITASPGTITGTVGVIRQISIGRGAPRSPRVRSARRAGSGKA